MTPANFCSPAVSLVRPAALRRLATAAGFADKPLLETVCNDLSVGARIGCSGSFRLPSKATNAPSAYENGKQVTDAICDWLSKGFAYGPIPLDEVPSIAKFSGLMTRPKPNGSVRIILNLSAPVGRAVNEGINNEDFPT